jgi:hypothetical protein
MSSKGSILAHPLSVYTLPVELLCNLSVRSIQAAPDPLSAGATGGDSASKPLGSQVIAGSGALRCQTCPNAGFDTIEEQRAHFKSDWHRYNAKAKLTGRAVAAEEWENMVEGGFQTPIVEMTPANPVGISSISGSASSSSGSSQSKITRLLNKQSLAPRDDSDEEAELLDRRRRAQLRTAIIWFSPTLPLDSLGVPKDTQFGVHRALFPPFDTAADYLAELRRMQLPTEAVEEEEERRITMLMVAGGHFAGMVVALRARDKRERQEVKGAGDIRVVKHKTFHRYTSEPPTTNLLYISSRVIGL